MDYGAETKSVTHRDSRRSQCDGLWNKCKFVNRVKIYYFQGE